MVYVQVENTHPPPKECDTRDSGIRTGTKQLMNNSRITHESEYLNNNTLKKLSLQDLPIRFIVQWESPMSR